MIRAPFLKAARQANGYTNRHTRNRDSNSKTHTGHSALTKQSTYSDKNNSKKRDGKLR